MTEKSKPNSGYWSKDAQALLDMGAKSIAADVVKGLLEDIELVRQALPMCEILPAKVGEVFEDRFGPADKVIAPWNDRTVTHLNAYQVCPYVHPFTGSNGTDLIATTLGWVEYPGGPVVQTWAHWFMVDGSAVRRLENSWKEDQEA